MTTSAPTITRVRIAVGAVPTAYWLLRIGAALCFIGHGAFGFITKAAWVPYFGVIGIPEPWAWRLMPVIGAVDILAGMAVLFAPRAMPLVYMVVWAAWTALLRPLAGEPMWEALERAGNYGVPLALLVLTGVPRSWREVWIVRDRPITSTQVLERVAVVLKWTTATLLAGHGAIAALTTSPVLGRHLEAIGLATSASSLIGWFEITLAVAIVVRPAVALLLLAGAWKLATESLWIAAGAPVWEFVERAGSCAAPLALAMLTWHTSSVPTSRVASSRSALGLSRSAAQRGGSSAAPTGATEHSPSDRLHKLQNLRQIAPHNRLRSAATSHRRHAARHSAHHQEASFGDRSAGVVRHRGL